jgi:hypothetical protein
VPPRNETQPLSSSCPIEAIAQAYLRTTEGDEGQALRIAITDALADLMEAGKSVRAHSRLIARGCVRSGLDDASEKPEADADLAA